MDVTVTINGFPRRFKRDLLRAAIRLRLTYPDSADTVASSIEAVCGVTRAEAIRLTVGAHHCIRQNIEP